MWPIPLRRVESRSNIIMRNDQSEITILSAPREQNEKKNGNQHDQSLWNTCSRTCATRTVLPRTAKTLTQEREHERHTTLFTIGIAMMKRTRNNKTKLICNNIYCVVDVNARPNRAGAGGSIQQKKHYFAGIGRQCVVDVALPLRPCVLFALWAKRNMNQLEIIVVMLVLRFTRRRDESLPFVRRGNAHKVATAPDTKIASILFDNFFNWICVWNMHDRRPSAACPEGETSYVLVSH